MKAMSQLLKVVGVFGLTAYASAAIASAVRTDGTMQERARNAALWPTLLAGCEASARRPRHRVR